MAIHISRYYWLSAGGGYAAKPFCYNYLGGMLKACVWPGGVTRLSLGFAFPSWLFSRSAFPQGFPLALPWLLSITTLCQVCMHPTFV